MGYCVVILLSADLMVCNNTGLMLLIAVDCLCQWLLTFFDTEKQCSSLVHGFKNYLALCTRLNSIFAFFCGKLDCCWWKIMSSIAVVFLFARVISCIPENIKS